MRLKYLFLIIVLLVSINAVYAAHNTTVVFFYGRGCPHCGKEKPFLETLELKYPQLKVHYYEIYYNKENSQLFQEMADAFETKIQGVPTTFIDDKIVVGFAEHMMPQLEATIVQCIEQGCSNPMDKLAKPEPIIEPEINESIVNDNESATSPLNLSEKIETETVQQPGSETAIKVPIFGEIDASNMSLPIFTFIIGLLDGFNPCAFFVLFFLLSMLIYARSRKRMLLIGGTFVFFSGLIYFLFMTAWLNFFLIVGQIMIMTTIAGIIAVIIAAINIKDFFFFKKGVSLTISEKAKPKLFDRMRNLLKASSLPSMMIGTIVLAVAANMYELLCTAGFPMVFTRILTLNNLSTAQYYFFLIMYNIVYVIPLATIVLIVTITLGAKKLTEEKGQSLKLISGMMMLCLGVILIARPELLNNIFVAVSIIAASLGVSGILILIKKAIKKNEMIEQKEEVNTPEDQQNQNIYERNQIKENKENSEQVINDENQ